VTTPRQSRRTHESGQGTLELLALVTIAAVLVGTLVPTMRLRSAEVGQAVACNLAKIVAAAKDDTTSCTVGAGDPGKPGDPDHPGEPDNPVDPDTPVVNPENPDDPACRDAMPSDGPLNAEHPTLVQVGCRNLYVTKDCQAEWDAYRGSLEGVPRAAAAGPLAACVAKTYDRIEPPCVTSSTSEVDRSEVKILFIKIGESDGMLVEHLGDGRVRIHLLEGTELGGELSASGKGVDFSVGGVTGYDNGTSYEFTEMGKAQEWLDWYQRYRKTDELIRGMSQVNACPMPGHCMPSPVMQQQIQQLMSSKEELKGHEPEHHDLSTSSVKKSKFSVSGGVTLPVTKGKGSGSGGLGPSISGDYTSEVQVEQRDWADGSMTASYKSTDLGGFLIGVKASGKATKPKKGGKDGDKTDRGSAEAGDALGREWSGNSTTSVTWGPDGKLAKLIVTLDNQAIDSLNRAGVDLAVALPYGFGLSGSYENKSKEGKANVTEMVLDFEQHPELRDQLGPRIDQMFPRNDKGDLKKGDVKVEFDEDGADSGDPVQDVLDEQANVRDLEYDLAENEQTGSFGVDFVGVDLFKASWTHIESEKDLTGSTFTVVDVNGDKQDISPAPKCKDVPFVAPEGYYTGGFSDPVIT
jgi:hypothetical protein